MRRDPVRDCSLATSAARRPRRRESRLREFLVCIALGGWSCSSTLEPPSGDPRLDLKHRDPRVRVLAIRDAVNAHRQDLVPLFIENLGDRDDSVRLFSLVALRRLTGEDHGYVASGSIAERSAAIERWIAWATARGLEVRSPNATASASSPDENTSLTAKSAAEDVRD